MGEILLASVNNVDVMVYDESTRQWIRPDDHAGTPSDAQQNCSVPDVQRLSHVQLLQNNNAYKIVAVRLKDHKVILNQILSNQYHRLKYKEANPLFHQWRNEFKQVIGLSFPSEAEAKRFYTMVRRSLEGGFPSQASNSAVSQEAVYQDMYQDPQTYYQQQPRQQQSQPPNNYHHINNQKQHSQSQPQMAVVNNRKPMEPDRDSLGSANGLIIHAGAGTTHIHRKSSQPTSNLPANVQQPIVQNNHHQLQQHQVQRRSSQGSNNSSGTNSSGTSCGAVAAGHIYASASINGEVGAYSPMASASLIPDQNEQLSQNPVMSQQIPVPPPPPPPPPALFPNINNNPASDRSRIPPISSNAPPPPPPPPPGSLKNLLANNKGLSLADQLKQAQLRKASAANNRTSCNSSSSNDTGIGSSNTSSKTSTISSTNSSVIGAGGQSDLLSELTDRLNRRKITIQATTPPGANPNEENLPPQKTSLGNHVESNGANSRIPWQKSAPSINNACNTSQPTIPPSNSTDSPRVHRKVPSGSSLSSQEESAATSNSKTLPAALNSHSAHTISSASTCNTAPITVADLEAFKKEMVRDFQRELAKVKEELLLAFRGIIVQQNDNK